MDKFRRADVKGSLEDFNRALSLDPAIRPYLWQRGLSLFYAGRRIIQHADLNFIMRCNQKPSKC